MRYERACDRSLESLGSAAREMIVSMEGCFMSPRSNRSLASSELDRHLDGQSRKASGSPDVLSSSDGSYSWLAVHRLEAPAWGNAGVSRSFAISAEVRESRTETRYLTTANAE